MDQGGAAMAPAETVAMIDKMTDEEFQHHVLEILHRELGVYGLARYIRVARSGSGDYTQDRHQWLDKMTIQDVIAQL
jgi:hypothetical protein